ncbi:MAG: hypothetical protein V4760_10640, partial [Bdellovibrionota bacterium]
MSLIVSSCELPKVGETKTIGIPEPVPSSYKLTRTGNKSFVASVMALLDPIETGPSFYRSYPEAGFEQGQQRARALRSKIDGCLAGYRDRLRGPNGEKLEIKLEPERPREFLRAAMVNGQLVVTRRDGSPLPDLGTDGVILDWNRAR